MHPANRCRTPTPSPRRLALQSMLQATRRTPRPLPVILKARLLLGSLECFGLIEYHQGFAGHILGHINDERGVVFLDHLD